MAQGFRPDRVGDQIRQELSELLSRGAVHDPGIGFITLTRVKVSPDLQQARVYYTSMGDEKARRETEKALARATPFFKRQVGQRLQLRRVPELQFQFDESIAHQDRVEQILRDLKEEEERRRVGPPERADEAALDRRVAERRDIPGDAEAKRTATTADTPDDPDRHD